MNLLKKFSNKLIPAVCISLIYQDEKIAENFFWSTKKKKLLNKNEVMYLWGNGYYQTRPENVDQYKNFRPKKIVGGSKNDSTLIKEVYSFEDVIFDEKNGFGLDKEGELWIFNNRKINSFPEKSNPKNFILENSKKINKDKLLNNLRKLDINKTFQKITMTQEYLWCLDEKGDLYKLNLKKINDEKLKIEDHIVKIKTINQLKNISSGENHLLMLKKNGELFSMGDDTMGQCGLGAMGRSEGGPFIETKVPNPEKIDFFKNSKIAEIYSKKNFNYVVNENKEVYAFGSNSKMQLANELDYSRNINPKLVVYEPISMNNYLREVKCNIKKIALGKDFTIFSCVNSENGRTQVFGCGHNSLGQLGNGYIKHVNNFQKIENLSDYTIPMEDGSQKNIEIDDITCGDNHCMALMNIGVVMIWGDNEFGQLGNKKRSFSVRPLISSRFKDKKVLKIKADYYNNYVLIEETKDIQDKDKK